MNSSTVIPRTLQFEVNSVIIFYISLETNSEESLAAVFPSGNANFTQRKKGGESVARKDSGIRIEMSRYFIWNLCVVGITVHKRAHMFYNQEKGLEFFF